VSDGQPFFRFNPGAYSQGRSFFTSSQRNCEACNLPCEWEYTGVIYAPTSPIVCARCIADGRLGALLGKGRFALHDIDISDAEPALAEEVLQRTPGVACFNPFSWPVLDAKPLAFMGYGGDEALIAIHAVRTVMEREFERFGWEFEPSPYVLIFKELDGDRYRAVIDLD